MKKKQEMESIFFSDLKFNIFFNSIHNSRLELL